MDKTQKEKIRDAVQEWLRKHDSPYIYVGNVDDLKNVVLDGSFDMEQLAEVIFDFVIKETEKRVVREIKEKNSLEIEKVNTYIAGKQGDRKK